MEEARDSLNKPMDGLNKFQEFMRLSLSPQVVEYLILCGYDRKSSFQNMDFSNKSTDSLNQIQALLCANGDILCSDPEKASKVYGVFHRNPERFVIFPGHRSQVIQFVHALNQIDTDDANLFITSSRSVAATYETDVSVEMPEEACSNGLRIGSRSFEQTETPRTSSDVGTVLEDVRKQIQRYIYGSEDPRVRQLSECSHYGLNMETNPYTNSFDIYTTCFLCHVKLKVHKNGGKFCLSNFFRHLKSCVNKHERSFQMMKASPAADVHYFPNSNSANSNDGSTSVVDMKRQLEFPAIQILDDDSNHHDIIPTHPRGSKIFIADVSATK